MPHTAFPRPVPPRAPAAGLWAPRAETAAHGGATGGRDPRFLTRRMRYFRPAAPPLASAQKSERPDVEADASARPSARRLKRAFLPLYVTFSWLFSLHNRPWKRRGMGWKRISKASCQPDMGTTALKGPPSALFRAWKRVAARADFNSLPNSAHACRGVSGGRAAGLFCPAALKKRAPAAAGADECL